METSTLPHKQESRPSSTGGKELPCLSRTPGKHPLPSLKQAPPQSPVHLEKQETGFLLCRLSSRTDLSFDSRIALDFTMRYKIPHGSGIRSAIHPDLEKNHPELLRDIIRLCTDTLHQNPERVLLELGTLGGGTHFVKIIRSLRDSTPYLIVHSNARTLGENTKQISRTGPDLQHLQNIICQYARLNRQLIARELMGDLCEKMEEAASEAELQLLFPPHQHSSLYHFQVP